MKRCLACECRHDATLVRCPACGAAPAQVDGFCAYAPQLAAGGGGFATRHFADLVRLEDHSFWFRARNRLILWALEKYAADFDSLLEIGCGTGYVLSAIARRFPDRRVFGSEVFASGLGFAAARLPGREFLQMDARDIPFVEEFAVVGAFDVLEHIVEDELVLAQIHAALKPRGLLFLTVPQHAWLWSAVDVQACHVRRYGAAGLRRKVEAAGFEVLRSTSFVSTLLPAMMLSRLLKKSAPPGAGAAAELAPPRWLDSLFFALLQFELALIRRGVDFPLGGSRLLIARKR